MSFNFNDVLDTPVKDIERPPLPPLGYYKFVTHDVRIREFDGKEGAKYQAIEWVLRGVAPYKEVDAEALAEWGDPKGLMLQKTFMFETSDRAAFENVQFQIRQFLEKVLQMDISEMDLKEAIAKSKGKFCVGEVNLRPDKNNPDTFYPNLKAVAPLE